MGLRFRTQEIYYVKSTTISEKEGDHFLILGATNIIVFFKKKKKDVYNFRCTGTE
jgi:hypothetical protein